MGVGANGATNMQHLKNFITSLHAANVIIFLFYVHKETEISYNLPWVILLMNVRDS